MAPKGKHYGVEPMNMRLAVICAIGPLDRYGYQNVYRECVASMCVLGDESI